MRLPRVNALVSHYRRTVTTGNKKEDSLLQVNIPAYISDDGTTADHEQTYTILFDTEDVSSEIDTDKDTIVHGSDVFKVMNTRKKTYHYTLRCIKML